MADVTINNLTGQAPTTSDVFPFSTTGITPSTYKASLTQMKTAMSLNNVENKSSATIRSEITSSNVTTALGYTPYNSSNPSGYITSASLPSSQQLARAWVCFDGINVVIRRAYNITNVTRNNTGRFTLTFASGTMPDGNYSICGSVNYDNTVNTGGAVTFYVMNQNSSTCQVGMRGYDGNYYNCHSVSCQFFY